MAKKEEPQKKAKLKYKVPKTVGGAIDLLFKVREGRKKLASEAEAEKAQESMIEALIFEMFGKGELEGAKGKTATCSIKRSDVPTINDWNKFMAYARLKGNDDLLRRQVVTDAFRLRLANKKKVPGVEVFTRVGLSLSRRK